MSRTITLIAAVGVALAVAVPSAWGQQDARSDGLNRMYGLGEYSPEIQALKLRSEGLNERYGLGTSAYGASAVRIEEARQNPVRVDGASTISMLDAREKAFATRLNVQLSHGTPPDVFERAVAARSSRSADHFLAADDRFRFDPSNQPVTTRVSVTGSGHEIEWPQVGMGFGVGVALILGLVLALRATRQRPLAH